MQRNPYPIAPVPHQKRRRNSVTAAKLGGSQSFGERQGWSAALSARSGPAFREEAQLLLGNGTFELSTIQVPESSLDTESPL